MKKLLIVFPLLFLLIGCSSMPTIEEAEEYTADGVEELLMEDNNDELTLRMDRYFLDEQIDDYTF